MTVDVGARAVNPLPSDEVRKALGERIGLTAHQIQVRIL